MAMLDKKSLAYLLDNIKYYKTVEEFLNSGYKPRGTVLIKASHSMHFSEIAEYIKKF